uniref:Uncharacterized protein n=1 Tax=Capitella teleta TaxID=283909 RepID=X2ALK7_CAPTE
PATLTLDKLRDTDEGEIRCTIYRTSEVPMRDSVSLNIVPVDDQIKFKITLKVSDNEVEYGQQTFIDFDEIITIEVPVESNSGAPMEVNAFKKCEEGDETPIGTKCIKESDVCRFETSAGCVGFTEGLVTIRATVQHPALDEAKELTCSYIVQDSEDGGSSVGDPLSGGLIAVIVIGVLLAVSLAGGAAYFCVFRNKPDTHERTGAKISM